MYGSKWGRHRRLRGGDGEVTAAIRKAQEEAIARHREVRDLIERNEERAAFAAYELHVRCLEETDDAARHDLREEDGR
jgi:hypothetical protein